MIKPIRIQRKRTKGYDMHAESRSINGLECVYVGRPTFWGNPYKIGSKGIYDAIDAVEAYKKYIIPYNHKTGCFVKFGIAEIILSEIENLRGKNLSCWCSLAHPCHADVLLDLANS